jgi:hypothetical protein
MLPCPVPCALINHGDPVAGELPVDGGGGGGGLVAAAPCVAGVDDAAGAVEGEVEVPWAAALEVPPNCGTSMVTWLSTIGTMPSKGAGPWLAPEKN